MIKSINRAEKKKIIFYNLFLYIPYTLIFYYKTNIRLFFSENKINFIYIYNGKYWQRIKMSSWGIGISLFHFLWCKQVAIYKKKTYLKKKKK